MEKVDTPPLPGLRLEPRRRQCVNTHNTRDLGALRFTVGDERSSIVNTPIRGDMEANIARGTVDFERRLSRSKGRSGRHASQARRSPRTEQSELATQQEAEEKRFGEWAREVLLREARSSRTDALFTEIVATRMLLNLVLKSIACGEVMTAEVFSNILTNVRTTKHQAATDVMEQYAAAGQKERS